MKKKKSFVFPGLSSLWATVFLAGCSNIVLLNPKGPIGEGERFVIIAAFALMLIVTLFFGGTIWIMYHLNYRLG